MRFFIVSRDGTVLDEFDAPNVLEATTSLEWRCAPMGAALVDLVSGTCVAKRRVGAVEILRTAAA